MATNETDPERPTPAEFEAASKVLGFLSREAIKANKKEDLYVCYAVYNIMRNKNLVDTKWNDYFDQIRRFHLNNIGSYVLTFTRVTNPLGLGYANSEISMEMLSENPITENELNNLLLFLDIERNQICVNNIQNINLSEWNSIITRINELKFIGLDQIRNQVFDKNVYEFNEFKQITRQ